MLKKKIFGLDISDHSIEALVLAKPFFGKSKVEAYSRVVMRGEVVKNGIIKNQKKLEENILKALQSAQPKPIKTPYCIVSLPESQVFTSIFKLPAGLKKKEVKNTIPFKAEEVIPFKTSEVYFDFKTLARIGETQEVFYVAAPSAVVDSYVSTLKNIGLSPVAFDLESVSLARSIVGKLSSTKAKMIVDIGARTTNLNIFDRGGIRQSLTLKIAGSRFTKSISTKLKVTEKEAVKLKTKSGFDPQKQNGKVLLILQNEFKRVVAEIKKLVEYYQVNSQRQISEIILVGGSSLLPKIDQYLADNIGIETNLGNPLKKISDPKELSKINSQAVLYANVSGLALRGLEKDPVYGDINLLPVPPSGFKLAPEKTDRRTWRLVYIRLAILLVLVVAFGAIFKLKLDNVDLYQQVYPTPAYDTNYSLDVDFEVLDELRGFIGTDASSTAAGTAGLAEDNPVLFNVVIRQTSLGFLNLRGGPAVTFEKLGTVDSGAEFEVVSEDNDWYEIVLEDESTGWVSAVYVDKSE